MKGCRIASNAAGEGPYGFSFELRRTTSPAAVATRAGAAAAALAARRRAGAVSARTGARPPGRAVAAAPKPRSWANRRRERGFANVSMHHLREGRPILHAPTPRRGGALEEGEIEERLLAAFAAHLGRGAQADADGGALRPAEEQAAVVVAQLDAAHAGRLAVRHARDRRGDRGGDAAGAAADPA